MIVNGILGLAAIQTINFHKPKFSYFGVDYAASLEHLMGMIPLSLPGPFDRIAVHGLESINIVGHPKFHSVFGFLQATCSVRSQFLDCINPAIEPCKRLHRFRKVQSHDCG